MNKTLTCIICPRGCPLTVSDESGRIAVSGNACTRGEAYGIAECTAPTRTVTSIIRVANRPDTMVSVKTSAPIPKEHIFDAMQRIRATTVDAPIAIGDVIIPAVYGADIIATKAIK